MSCFVEGREDVVVEGGASAVGFGGREEWDGDAKGALSGERRKEVSVSGVSVRCWRGMLGRKSK